MKPREIDWAGIFVAQARRSLEKHHLPRITRCLKLLSPEQIGWRPHPTSNSVGNLALHLSGNVQQWITSGLGGAPTAASAIRNSWRAGRCLVPRCSNVSEARWPRPAGCFTGFGRPTWRGRIPSRAFASAASSRSPRGRTLRLPHRPDHLRHQAPARRRPGLHAVARREEAPRPRPAVALRSPPRPGPSYAETGWPKAAYGSVKTLQTTSIDELV